MGTPLLFGDSIKYNLKNNTHFLHNTIHLLLQLTNWSTGSLPYFLRGPSGLFITQVKETLRTRLPLNRLLVVFIYCCFFVLFLFRLSSANLKSQHVYQDGMQTTSYDTNIGAVDC